MLQSTLKVPTKAVGAKRLIFVSDNHLGNKSTPTPMMVEALDATVTNYDVMCNADGLIFCGDLFDRLLNLPLSGVSEIHGWFIDLLYMSKTTNCPIRILEGTPSHDWKQSKLLCSLNDFFKLGADVQYIDELSIVEDKSLGLTIGYIPDEWRESHQQTTDEFMELMKTRGIGQVDYMVMHGLFEFQIPKVKIPTFDSSLWCKIVKYNILIGHDHNHKTFNNIIVPGSHNRLSMNEEAPKGFVVSDILNNSVTNTFVINSQAKRYDTLDFTDIDDDVALPIFKERLQLLSEAESKLRLRLSEHSNLQVSAAELKHCYSLVTVVCERSKKQQAIEEMETVFSATRDVININPDNVADMILREIQAKTDAQVSNETEIKYELEEIASML